EAVVSGSGSTQIRGLAGVSGADSRRAVAVFGRNGSSQTQVKAESRDESPKAQVISRRRLAHKSCRKTAAAFRCQFSVKLAYRERCAIFLPLWCGRSGRSSKSKLCKAASEERRAGRAQWAGIRIQGSAGRSQEAGVRDLGSEVSGNHMYKAVGTFPTRVTVTDAGVGVARAAGIATETEAAI